MNEEQLTNPTPVPLGFRPEELSPLALAFLGDAIWEVYARQHCLSKGIRKPGELHKACTRYVSATAQAKISEWMVPLLTEVESSWVRRGRNAKSAHVRKNVDVIVYRYSTGFETLMGYLASSGQSERIAELATQTMNWIDNAKVQK
jgi:ribonuclease III family protein